METNPIQEFKLNSIGERLDSELVDVGVLMEVLGYKDIRSVRKWCKAHNVPLFKYGKRTYTIEDAVPGYNHKMDNVQKESHINKTGSTKDCQSFAHELMEKYKNVKGTRKI